MEFTKFFGEIGKDDASTAGGKGASLGEMTQAGIPVPPGFVILADAFERFIIETGLTADIDAILEKVNHKEMHTVEHASETIQALILHAEMPSDLREEIDAAFKDLNTEFVAVRSSATAEDGAEAAWAGQLDTFLNTTQETLLEKVRECWASLFTPRAIFYRFEKGMNVQKISVAVVVQKMVNSDAAGIAFSVHPVTEDRNQMIIEAGFGLGEAVVSGQVTPDSYVVTKEPRAIIDKNISEQAQGIYRKLGGGNEWKDLPTEKGSSQVLTDAQIFLLSEVLIQIENHYGFPVDTEWAMENDELYIVQSRPITTLSNNAAAETKEIILTKSFSREHSLFYVYPWRISNCEYGERWLDRNIEDALYMRPHGTKIIEVWYGIHLFDNYHADITAQIEKDSTWFPRLVSSFEDEWKVISSYIQKKEPLTKEELADFYEHWINWWEPMAIMMELPEVEILPEDIRKKAYDLRANTQEYSATSDVLYLKYIEQTHPELSPYFSVLAPDEVFADMFPSEDILKDRLNGWFLTSNEFHLIENLDRVLAERNFVLEKPDADQKELKGQTAYKGKVRGKVRVVVQKDQVASVQEGEIIVSPMTTPEFMPALQKAAAFVTDEGGITCHAAIIARELQKPCITGTKFATQILRDGDEVEVDADKGIVRILTTSKRKFEKTYTRDTTLILQGTWATDQSIIAPKYLGMKNLPLPGIIHYVHNGTVEIWENLEATQALMDHLLEKNKSDKDFFPTHLAAYKKDLEEIKRFWEKKALTTKEDLKEYVTKLQSIETGFTIYYRTAYDDRSPQNLRDLALEVRNEDVFFSVGDMFLHDSLGKVFPELEGYQNYILANEIDNPPPLDILKKRMEGFLIVDGAEPYLGKLEGFAAEHPGYEFAFEKVEEGLKELKGQIAFKGKITGRVKLLFRREEIHGVKEGDILVAPMTTPDFLPAMQKASAFITDEGGITCHAAIVAREMKKPCIIGTKIATQVLSDGDEVEVDANSGIVRILRKTSGASDFSLTFEGQKIPVLLSEIICLGYLPLDSCILYKEDVYKQFYSKESIAKMEDIGKDFFSNSQNIKTTIKKLEGLFEGVAKDLEEPKITGKISASEVETAFNTLVSMNNLYSRFDFPYTDGAYGLSKEGSEIEGNLKLVEQEKNRIREEYNKVFFDQTGLLSKVLETLAELFSIPTNDLYWYMKIDLLNLFKGDVLSKENIEERKLAYVFNKIDNKYSPLFLQGKEALEYISSFGITTPSFSGSGLLKGVTANKTEKVISGEVFILDTDYGDLGKTKEEMAKMKQGQILVAPTTAPEHMDAIRKAAAIVVDVGGLLSHTAIVSRELGIPSIVGTQFGSKVLKTGDVVEVDPETGTIRKM